MTNKDWKLIYEAIKNTTPYKANKQVKEYITKLKDTLCCYFDCNTLAYIELNEINK